MHAFDISILQRSVECPATSTEQYAQKHPKKDLGREFTNSMPGAMPPEVQHRIHCVPLSCRFRGSATWASQEQDEKAGFGRP